MSSAADGVPFRFHPNGVLRKYAWPIDPEDGWVAYDRNSNGDIDDASELFGNATPMPSGQTAAEGFQALSVFDTNQDGQIDGADARFNELRLWRDVVRNGRVDSGELAPLSTVGVLSIDLAFEESRWVDRWNNAFKYRSGARMSSNPSRRVVWDVFITSAEID